MTVKAMTRRNWIAASLGVPLMAPTWSGASVPAGQIPFRTAQVDSADGQTFDLAWSAPSAAGLVTIFARTTPDADPVQGPGRLVGRGGAIGDLKVDDLPASVRWYFELRPDHGQALVIADRSLHLRSAPNFRDVGGYRTLDGRWVRMGVAYRSDQLDRLSDADLAKIATLQPVLVADLRTDAERRIGSDRLPPNAQPLVADVMAGTPPGAAAVMQAKDPQDAAAFLTNANRQFVSGASARDAYRLLMSRLADSDGVDVYHCTAGKDRTGWASAVLLKILGVPQQTIIEDYLASNRYLVDKNKAMFSSMPPDRAAVLAPVMTVRADYLDAAFAEVTLRYGAFGRYLSEGLHLDGETLARLRAKFLVGAAYG
jgi:protein-tyrosine phosphatase